MTQWIRFDYQGKTEIGTLTGDTVSEYKGGLFDSPQPTGRSMPLSDVQLKAPLVPHSIFALWNNFHERAQKESQTLPDVPLYFMKPITSVIGPGETIYRPRGHQGRVIFEAELGIVIGSTCQEISKEEAVQYIFGYTCVNDVTAMQLIHEKEAFAQWSRAKSFDTFGAIGPCISTLSNADALTVRTLVNGRERQNYPIKDMIFFLF